jgi:AraC-like DNA-binding protein
MEHAGLLLNAGTKLEEVAKQAGFSGTDHFTRAYKREVGTHPACNSSLRKSDPDNEVSLRDAPEVPVFPLNHCDDLIAL